MTICETSWRHQRGRNCSLSSFRERSSGDSSAARRSADHPGLDRRRLHENALLLSEGPYCIARHVKRLMPIVGHEAGLEGDLMDEVSVAFGPILEKIDSIIEGGYLTDDAFLLFEINRSVEHLRGHFYLTENVGDQQGKRCGAAPSYDLCFLVFPFKIADGHAGVECERRGIA